MLSALLDFLARTRVAHCRRAPDAAHASLISHERADASDLDEDSPTLRDATRLQWRIAKQAHHVVRGDLNECVQAWLREAPTVGWLAVEAAYGVVDQPPRAWR